MAITGFQREVCRLLARGRVERGESYVAGGVALNTLIEAARISRDIDLFHDTKEALAATWAADRELLNAAGLEVEVLRERPAFVEAMVRRGAQAVAAQWVCDSAYRFFPLVEHPDFGLVLHTLDLATNKLLALVGRVEVRDWIDMIECADRLQPLGYLAWAACGKDPGYGPALILAEAGRSARHSQDEVDELAFEGPPPDAAQLSRRWAVQMRLAREVIERLPPEEVGRCVLLRDASLFAGTASELEVALRSGEVCFHPGRIGGAFPTIEAGRS